MGVRRVGWRELAPLSPPRRLTCEDCLANSSQCAWCQSTHTCFLFAAYLARYPHGGCRGWDDRYPPALGGVATEGPRLGACPGR